jgi:hypothetical protein
MASDNIEVNEINTGEFYKIVREFIPDLLTTFPEYKDNLHDGIISILEEDYDNELSMYIYNYCKEIFPERFFDILYQNDEMFSDDDINTEFLPNIDFSDLWNTEDISEKTKEVLWKYLQLIMFSLLSDIKDGSIFKDTAKLFEAIDENEFKNKLEETMNNMQDIFGNTEDDEAIDGSNINIDNLPKPDEIHDHINGMLGGKLGNLAREIAEETAEELNVNMDDVNSVGDVFNKLFKNPSKLMGIVKNVGNKLESKIRSGDIDESELIKETTEMMGKMNNIPGMGNIKGMLDQFGMGGLAGMMGGKNVKMNMGAFNNHMKGMQMRERMKKKVEERKNIQEEFKGSMPDELHNKKVFRKGDAPERSVRVKKETFEESIIMNEPSNSNKSKVKKDKKKRKKNKK